MLITPLLPAAVVLSAVSLSESILNNEDKPVRLEYACLVNFLTFNKEQLTDVFPSFSHCNSFDIPVTDVNTQESVQVNRHRVV